MAGQVACIDCRRDGITTPRKPVVRNGKPVPGSRCTTHWRAKRTATRDTAWERRLMALYGLLPEEYERIKAQQGGKCALCQRATGAVRRLAVDHDHQTGVIRGCLCKRDNVLLGHARDQIEFFERCIEYLKNPPAVQVLGERVAPVESLTSNEEVR